jgi:hypothetical protein
MIKRIVIIFLLTVITTIPLKTFATVKNFIIGTYKIKYPFETGIGLIQNDENGKWLSLSGIPNLYKSGINESCYFNEINCEGNNCVIVGSCHGDQPILLNSKNHGLDWTVPEAIHNINIKTKYLTGYLTHADCANNICTVAGILKDEVSVESAQYGSIISFDGGSTWTTSSMSFQSPQLQDPIKQFACINQTCLAAQGNKDDALQVILSVDHGQNWKKSDLSLNKIKVKGLTASLTNYVFIGEKDNYPILLSTQDGKKLNNITMKYPNDMIRGNFQLVKCKDKLCVSAGEYSTKTENSLPLISVSVDGGYSWILLEAKDVLTNYYNLFMYFIDCTNDACVVVGSYSTSTASKPLSLTIKYSDHHFSVTNTALYLDQKLRLGSVSCTMDECILAATFYSKEKDKDVLQIFYSDKTISNWQNMTGNNIMKFDDFSIGGSKLLS